jgi:alpha,alpha-trehalase
LFSREHFLFGIVFDRIHGFFRGPWFWRNQKRLAFKKTLLSPNMRPVWTISSIFKKNLITYLPEDKDAHIGLPNRFIAPSIPEGIFQNDQFYWDSYFINLGLLELGEVELAKGMADSFAYLCDRFGIMPSRNRYFNLGISQPPFFTSMALEVFEKTQDIRWLKNMANIAEKELKEYWMDDKCMHKVHKDLSRYCDHYCLHLTSEHESGWEMTSRFSDRCMDFLPIDLNTLLYKYEVDLFSLYTLFKKGDRAERYRKAAEKRKKEINTLVWDEEKGMYFDYDYRNEKPSGFCSLAAYFPLWAGIADKHQAERLRQNLMIFERGGGLSTTQPECLSGQFRQWDHPNGWPNLHWIVIKGLWNYGFHEDAKRIAKKWLDLNKEVFEKTGYFWEKYDVIDRQLGLSGHYANTQRGFGWTNMVFVKLVALLREDTLY